MILASQTFAYGEVWMSDGSGGLVEADLTVHIVPVPAAVLLGVLGLGYTGMRLRKMA